LRADLGVENCTECDRLWREYARATIKQFQLQGKLRVASLELRREEIQGLTVSVETAAAAKEQAREAMPRHESTHGAVQAARG
jgi:hypothetical protein